MDKAKLKNFFCPAISPANNKADGLKCPALQHIIGSMPNTIFYQRSLVNEAYDYISPSCEQILGLSADELNKMTVKEIIQQLVHPDDHLPLQEAIAHLVVTNNGRVKNSLEVEHRLKCRDGKYRWFSESLCVIFDEMGVPSAIIGCGRDLSSTVSLQHALDLCQLRFKNLYNVARIALFYSTTKGDRILECNNLFAWTLGFNSPAECVADFSFAQNSVNPAEYQKIVSDTRDSKIVNNREIQLRRKDGSVCWMSISAFWYEGEYFGGSALDITAAKNLSEIEASIFKLLMAGLSNKEIAARLSRSRRTIEQHRASIMKKLDAQNLIDLATRNASVIL